MSHSTHLYPSTIWTSRMEYAWRATRPTCSYALSSTFMLPLPHDAPIKNLNRWSKHHSTHMKQASLYTDEAGIGLHNSATIRNTDEFQRPHNFTEWYAYQKTLIWAIFHKAVDLMLHTPQIHAMMHTRLLLIINYPLRYTRSVSLSL